MGTSDGSSNQKMPDDLTACGQAEAGADRGEGARGLALHAPALCEGPRARCGRTHQDDAVVGV